MATFNKEFAVLHKRKPVGFGDIGVKREETSKLRRSLRHARRTECFNKRRNLGEPEVPAQHEIQGGQDNKHDTIVDRRKELKEYLKRKEALKKNESKTKRPPFIVGIPHHGSSPVLRELTNVNNQNKKCGKLLEQNEVRHQRTTRSSAKGGLQHVIKKSNIIGPGKLEIKKVPQKGKTGGISSPIRAFPLPGNNTGFTFRAKISTSSKPLTSPHTPTVLKRSTQKKQFTKPVVPPHTPPVFQKGAGKNPKIKRTLVTYVMQPKSEESGLEAGSIITHSTSTMDQNIKKDISVKEETLSPEKTGESLDGISLLSVEKEEPQNPSNPTSNMLENYNLNLRPASPSSTRESEAQRERLKKESDRLLSLADKWQSVAEQECLPTQDITDEIDSLVGQTRLLTKDKFNQFRRLVDQFEQSSGDHKITVNDLNGFWDMMYLQVEQLTKRYADLEILKNNNWSKPEPVTTKKKRILKNPENKTSGVASSSIRDMIRSKRAKSGTISEEIATKTPPPLKRDSMSRVLSSSRKILRNSMSPYIAMRLSSCGRSTGNFSNVVDSSPSPRNSNDFSIMTECSQSNTITVKEESCASTSTSSNEVNAQDDCNKTPRRSLRLRGRTPTPLARSCPACNSNSCCNKNAENYKSTKPKTPKKRFVLKPSNLIVPDTSSEEMSPVSNYVQNEKETRNAEENTLAGLRRSTRKSKRVGFHASEDGKKKVKLPSTPFVKYDKKKAQEEFD